MPSMQTNDDRGDLSLPGNPGGVSTSRQGLPFVDVPLLSARAKRQYKNFAFRQGSPGVRFATLPPNPEITQPSTSRSVPRSLSRNSYSPQWLPVSNTENAHPPNASESDVAPTPMIDERQERQALSNSKAPRKSKTVQQVGGSSSEDEVVVPKRRRKNVRRKEKPDVNKGDGSKSKKKRKGKAELGGTRTDESSGAELFDDYDEPSTSRQNGMETSDGERMGRKRTEEERPKNNRGKEKRRKKIFDPDEVNIAVTDDEEDMVAALELDQPERFRKTTRLRKRHETKQQRMIRKIKNKRLGIVEDSSSESSSDGKSWTPTSDSATDSEAPVGSDDFIIEDGGIVPDHMLPHQFSRNAAQTPEFKLKVVYQYFVLLAIEGPSILPLTGDNAQYLMPQLEDQRRKISSLRDGGVRGQIWRPDLVRALETFPHFSTDQLDQAEPGCDVCHIGTRMSKFEVSLSGEPYDRNTYDFIESEDDSESSASSSSTAVSKLPRKFLMGRFCHRRAEMYHKLTHWEYTLYLTVRRAYNDLLRAKFKPVRSDSEASPSDDDSDSDRDRRNDRKRKLDARRRVTAARVAQLRKGGLPDKYRDVNKVTEWMEEKGYQLNEFRRMQKMMDDSQALEHDKSRDD